MQLHNNSGYMTVIIDVSDDLMENLAPMNPVSKRYKGGLS